MKGNTCNVCLAPSKFNQRTLDGQLADINYLCPGCKKLPAEEQILVYDGLGWRALMNSDRFEEIFGHPTGNICQLSKLKALRAAKEEATQDEEYVRQVRELDDLYSELDYHEGEAARVSYEIEAIKKDITYYKDYIFGELFQEIGMQKL